MGLKRSSDHGFTLIELLVVVAIIGILAAIAIPQYSTYRIQSLDADSKSNLHNAATAMEAYYGSNALTYVGASIAVLISSFGYKQSAGVDIGISNVTQLRFTLTASAAGGSKSFSFDSQNGKIL